MNVLNVAVLLGTYLVVTAYCMAAGYFCNREKFEQFYEAKCQSNPRRRTKTGIFIAGNYLGQLIGWSTAAATYSSLCSQIGITEPQPLIFIISLFMTWILGALLGSLFLTMPVIRFSRWITSNTIDRAYAALDWISAKVNHPTPE